MNLNLNKETISAITNRMSAFVIKYAVFIIVLLTLGLFGFLVYRIGTLANKEPSEAAIEEKMGENRSLNIDKSAVEKIQELQSSNIEVKALFDQNRDNPFQE